MPSSDSPMSLIISKCTVFPDLPSSLDDLPLSVSDLPMLSCHYIQKGLLFPLPPYPIIPSTLIPLLKSSLSQTLSRFPPLAGRLTTYPTGHVYISCNDAGADFIHASAPSLSIRDVLGPADVPDCVKELFAFDRTVSYTGHHNAILAVQVTELNDAVFIGCSVNHAVTDGTSFWNFFNTFAELCRASSLSPNENYNYKKLTITRQPDFSRNSVLISPAVLRFPDGGPKVTFNVDEPLRERIFSFSREAIQKLKARTNNKKWSENEDVLLSAVEILGKQSNDPYQNNDNGARVTSIIENWFKTSNANSKTTAEISSFQSLCSLLWRSVTRARNLPSSQTTTFRMAVNCRHRLEPKLDAFYFGNAIQSIPTYATAEEVLSHDTKWCAEQLNKSVKAHDNNSVRGVIEDWERNPRVFPLGNFDGAMMTMGSSPRFPMYDNDFGWGRPMAIRSGRANKFDGKISAFPGREGGGSVDLEVVLAPDAMAGLETDSEFMQYVNDARNAAGRSSLHRVPPFGESLRARSAAEMEG
ncbi:acetyltransferase [Pyrus ussuriensis x Pyrus communis]|uniref:Acetyltransferase n=1 Tax=Pyrus ussuriensis x Pyrus communis TaxID=2448454 RepID=A0A5N5EZF0_9ROSA|nr:acetyltransferase [Pyrus ussuriensis x Pyrus communis]